jgi:release factor glutamine methyltransferase
MTTYAEIINRLTQAAANVYEPREARSVALWAVESLTGADRMKLLVDPRATIESIDEVELARYERELAAARPIQYIIGATEFCGLQFAVGEGVLIPRPETEELVRWITEESSSAKRILDIGTGSGAIAVSLAAMLPKAEVAAMDISDTALQYTVHNAAANNAKVKVIKGDALGEWWREFEELDVVVSNPPYVPDSDRATIRRNVLDYEPSLALFVPDDDLLRFYRAIANGAAHSLRKGGELYFEIYENAADKMVQMLTEQGWQQIELRRDFNDKNRMIRCRKSL